MSKYHSLKKNYPNQPVEDNIIDKKSIEDNIVDKKNGRR